MHAIIATLCMLLHARLALHMGEMRRALSDRLGWGDQLACIAGGDGHRDAHCMHLG